MVTDLYNSERSYRNRLKNALNSNIHKENKKVLKDFLDKKESLLKSQYGQEQHSLIRYYKTLQKDLDFITTISRWFNKPLTKITSQDIKSVYDGLEKNLIVKNDGKPYSNSTKEDYYAKVFKGSIFKHIGKQELAREIVLRKFPRNENEVRFFRYNDFLKFQELFIDIKHKLLFWLMYDIGVEIQAILQLKKSDFTKEFDYDTREDHYIVHVPLDISKKNRQKRNISVYHQKTVDLLDSYLQQKDTNQNLFDFKPANVNKLIKDRYKKVGFYAHPKLVKPTPKDFRSSCATYFLTQLSWSTDDVKFRLGHSPSSTEIDKYVSYFGLNQKKKINESRNQEVLQYKDQIDLSNQQNRYLNDKLKELNSRLAHFERIEEQKQQDKETIIEFENFMACTFVKHPSLPNTALSNGYDYCHTKGNKLIFYLNRRLVKEFQFNFKESIKEASSFLHQPLNPDIELYNRDLKKYNDDLDEYYKTVKSKSIQH